MATRELKARPFLQPLPCSLCAPLTLLPLLKADHGRDDDALATILAGHVQIQTVALSSGYHWSSDPVQALSRAPFGEPFGQSLCRGLCARRGGRGVGRAAGGGGGRRRCVLMVCDFFYPQVGGVEGHIYALAQRLLARGSRVVVMTHAYGARGGTRYLTDGLKVYYVPRAPWLMDSDTFPTLFGGFRVLRAIILREGVDVVHGHQTLSTMAQEAVLHAGTMGLPTVFTDHSLFGFSDVASILANKLQKFTLSDCDAVICVSHTSKENTVLRSCVPPSRVFVVPNAVDTAQFCPIPETRPERRNLTRRSPECARGGALTVVVLSRLAYRKGAGLLALLLPVACERFPDLHFLVGGDGPARGMLEERVEDLGLEDRVKFAGFVPHHRAAEFLSEGDIFLNTSLTEAFCMAVVEAAAVGLPVVSTAVGGVPEVLPASMIVLARPEAASLVDGLAEARRRVRSITHLAQHRAEQHNAIASMYSWKDVAERTDAVYDHVISGPGRREGGLLRRMERMYPCGAVAGKLFCAVAVVDDFYWRVLEWLFPASDIELAAEIPAGYQTFPE